ncbi:hypothetical protein SAE02_36020 [Skermanella aerolata]|uniref:Antitoxin n=1 Tax=Skermanella aerolata TaxID=393310 RepID=A0A512DSK5_9PROT|nr:hypothetical protein [Skermanella aerolata]GEO39454.1 hypothetical protein SAE02_36020 [Skermanella aerolata]
MPVDTETGDGGAAESVKRRRYTLDELIAKCDPTAPAPEIDRLWTEGEPVGDEVL